MSHFLRTSFFRLSASSIGSADLTQTSEYVVFSMDSFMDMVLMIRNSVGSIFSVALYTFVLILGIYVVISLVNYFVGG